MVIDEGSDLDEVIPRIVIGAFYQSGQSCISVQRIIAHESIYKSLKDKLVEASSKLICGDPKEEKTFIGPLIDSKDVKRLKGWLAEAIEGGASLLCGGQEINERLLSATLLEDVPRDCELYKKEAFGPVAILSKYSSFDAALELVNDSEYGLQAGGFSND